MRIAGRDIGPGYPCYVVAELSANHAGSLDRAVKLIHEAKKAGADAVKVQAFAPEEMAMPGVKCPSGPWAGRDLVDLYRSAVTPRAWFPRLFAEAEKVGITLFSSVFSPSDVDFLETAVDCPAYKVASPEAGYDDLLRAVRKTGKPLFVSLGALDEYQSKLFMYLGDGDDEHTCLMHCVSAYPAPVESMNLRTITRMREETNGAVIGLSDHSTGTLAATTAVTLGASVIEKHLMLSPTDYPTDEEWPLDSAFSLEPNDFGWLVASVRTAERMLGTVKLGGHSDYARSCWVVKPVAKGQALTPQNVKVLRPAGGLPPWRYPTGVASRDLEPGPLTQDMIA